MKIHLAGIQMLEQFGIPFDKSVYTLCSYPYITKKIEDEFEFNDNFMLDSGAFSFMNGVGVNSWEDYVDQYGDFIVRHNIKYFFEVDIDSVVGYEKVIELRNRLEDRVGRPCIPVWHNSRGKDEFINHCQLYPYVSIGGLVDSFFGEYAKSLWKYFPWFIKMAHENEAKIHALGFSSPEGLEKYHFDSVDSTTWLGGKYGKVYYFNGKRPITIMKTGVVGVRIKDLKSLHRHNYAEWVKYQRYAFKHL